MLACLSSIASDVRLMSVDLYTNGSGGITLTNRPNQFIAILHTEFFTNDWFLDYAGVISTNPSSVGFTNAINQKMFVAATSVTISDSGESLANKTYDFLATNSYVFAGNNDYAIIFSGGLWKIQHADGEIRVYYTSTNLLGPWSLGDNGTSPAPITTVIPPSITTNNPYGLFYTVPPSQYDGDDITPPSSRMTDGDGVQVPPSPWD